MDYVKSEGLKQIKEREVLNSIQSFRSELITTLNKPNTNLTYLSKLDPSNIKIYLSNNIINGRYINNNFKIDKNISTLGFRFCSSYNFSPYINSTFTNNGSCIILN